MRTARAFRLWSTIFVVACSAGVVAGQTSSITIGSGSGMAGTSGNNVPVYLNNQEAVAGLVLAVSYDPTVLNPTGVLASARTTSQSGLGLGISQPGELIVTMFDVQGAQLEAGSGEVFRLQFDVLPTASVTTVALIVPLAVAAQQVAAPSYQMISVALQGGSFTVTPNLLSRPSNLTAAKTGGQVVLHWSAPPVGKATPGAAQGSPGEVLLSVVQSYNVYRSGNPGARSSGGRIASVPAPATTYTDQAHGAGPQFYQVTALFKEGESLPSNEAGVEATGVGLPEQEGIPSTFMLLQNYPNPFNPTTKIRYGLPRHARVTLDVFNVLGEVVFREADQDQQAGYHEIVFRAEGLASGVYFYRLVASDAAQGKVFAETRKLIVLR